MDFYGVWATRIKSVLAKIVELIWVVVIYLLSELAIWGLSRVMAPAGIEFFASILGMVIVFAMMTSLYLWSLSCDRIYQRWIKSKVRDCGASPFPEDTQVSYTHLRSTSSTCTWVSVSQFLWLWWTPVRSSKDTRLPLWSQILVRGPVSIQPFAQPTNILIWKLSRTLFHGQPSFSWLFF